MGGFESGKTLLVLVRVQMQHHRSVVFPEEKVRCRAPFLEQISDSVFLFEKSCNQQSLLQNPAWMDRQGQAGSHEEGGFLCRGCNPLITWRGHDSAIHFTSQDHKPMSFSGFRPLEAILELQGEIISLQKCRSSFILVL